MFESVKDRKAREEEQLRKQEAMAAMQRALARVEGGSGECKDALYEMERSQESLDGALNQVVSLVHKIRKNGASQAREEEELRRHLFEICQSLCRKEEADRRGMEAVREKQQELKECIGQGSGTGEALKSLRQWAGEFDQELAQAGQRAAVMEEQARSMSILSLNAAIEAGRMGASGRKFVAAAEEVRSGAGESCGAAEQLRQELNRMQEAFQAAAEQLQKLEERQAAQEEKLARAAAGVERSLAQTAGLGRSPAQEAEEDPAALQMSSYGGQLEKLHKSWEQTADAASRQESSLEQILSQMEAAGESYMKEQQLLDQLKDWQQQIQRAMEEKALWV